MNITEDKVILKTDKLIHVVIVTLPFITRKPLHYTPCAVAFVFGKIFRRPAARDFDSPLGMPKIRCAKSVTDSAKKVCEKWGISEIPEFSAFAFAF